LSKLTTTKRLAIGFLFIVILLLTNAGFSYINTRRLIENQAWVTHSYKVINEADDLLSLLKDAETGTRGYVVTGQEEYLDPYKTAAKNIKGRIEPFRKLVADNPAQVTRIAEFADAANARLVLLEQTIELRRLQGFEAAQRSMLSGIGRKHMKEARAVADTIVKEENRLLTQRNTQTVLSVQLVTLTRVFFTLVNLVLMGFIWYLLGRAEVSSEKLAVTVGDLEKSEEMRESLTAMLVHDLRTPLTTLLGSLDLLNQQSAQPLDPELQKEMIGISVQGGYRLLSLVNELLDISKMESGEMKLRLDTVQVDAVAKEAVSQVQAFYVGDETLRTAAITLDIPHDLPIVQGDHELLVRVMINLLGNALKFTPKTGTVTLSARQINPLKDKFREAIAMTKDHPLGMPGSVVLCSVRDTGEGIPQEDSGKIFDKFGQVESRKSGRKNSTGLGLTFCKLVIEAHGGQIWVESELGKGSTFFFTVPIRPSALDRDSEQTIKADATAQS